MRLAVFFTPPADDPLTLAAAAWLGRDAFSGAIVPQPPVEGFTTVGLQALTADPRRYGFHATLKPPFHLADGRSAPEVEAAAVAFWRGRVPVRIPALALTRIGPFFALTEEGPIAALDALAGDVVRAFDPFRAPPSPQEIMRRQPARLSPRQLQYLGRWGYPYVFDQFQFHMSLTGPVPEGERDAMEAALRHHFARFIGEPLSVDSLALFVEPHPPGDFVVERRIPFTAPAEPTDSA